MTARDTIAAALHRKCVKPDCAAPTDWDREGADAVITAIRGMPIGDVAQLIGGDVYPRVWVGGEITQASIEVKR